MPRISTAFELRGIEPAADWVWQAAGESVHRDFWREVVRLAKLAKDRELKAGLDRYGNPLAPLAESTREHRRSEMGTADPDAPPLTPAYGLSRTRVWFDGRAFANHAEFFWRGGWGRILHFHRVGAGRLPVRDVIGLSRGSEAWVRAQAARWWSQRRDNLVADFDTGRIAATLRLQPGRTTRRVERPAPIPVVGITDLTRLSGGTAEGDARVRRAIAAGTFTGFRKLGPRRKASRWRMPKIQPPGRGR